MARGKKGAKISDLAGSWKMSDKEAEEIMAAIEAGWKKTARSVNRQSEKF